jgi:hypothetical protein
MRPWLFALLFGIGLLQALHYMISHTIDGDTSQVLNHAIALADRGELVPYGPATSSGASGQVPGPFLSIVMGYPLKWNGSLYGSLIAILLLHILGFYLLYEVFQYELDSKWVLIGLTLMYWINPYRAAEVYLWNPAYIFAVSALHLWSVHKLKTVPGHFLATTLAVLSLAWGLQVHPSILILVGVTLCMWWLQKLKPSRIGIFFGASLGALSLLPYILKIIENPGLIPKTSSNSENYLFFGLLNVWPVLKGLWYWIMFSGFAPTSQLFKYVSLEWVTSSEVGLKVISYLWKTIAALFALLGFYFSVKSNILWLRALKLRNLREASFLDHYAISTLLMIVLFLSISPTTPQYWHVLYAFPIALYPGIRALSQNLIVPSKSILLGLTTFFILFNFLGAMKSKKHDSLTGNLNQRFLEFKQKQ